MRSTVSTRGAIRRPSGRLAAQIAVAGCLVCTSAAIGQTLNATTASPELRGTAETAAINPSQTADDFRSSPASNYDETRSDSKADPNADTAADPARAPIADPAADEPPRRSRAPVEPDQLPPKPPGIAKPVKPVKEYGPKKARPHTALPELQPYRTAIRKRGSGFVVPSGLKIHLRGSTAAADAPAADDLFLARPPGPTVAALPTPEPPRKPIVDEAPYAPVGIGVGSMRLTPYVETDGGYDSNPDQTTKSLAKPSAVAHVEAGTAFQSDWSRHSLGGELHGGYYDYFDDRAANRPEGAGTVNGRIDVTRDTTIDTAGRFSVGTQRPGSPEIVLGTAAAQINNRPLQYSYGGDAGVTQKFGRVAASLKGSFDRYGYEDATFSDGSSIPLSHNNYNQYGVKARLTYELTPAISPYLEGYANIRRFDYRVDSGGTDRRSTGEGGHVGSTFELGRKLVGDVSVGYENRDYVSKTLGPFKAPLVDASLVYRATPLTTVTLKAGSELDETNIPGSSGSVSRKVSLELSHALMRNLVVTGLLAYQNIDYNGIKLTQNVYDAGLKADYSLSRSVMIRGSFTHERLQSGVPGLDYTQNVFLLGLRLQR